MKFTLPRGMRDITADDMAKRNYVYEKIAAALRRYGFRLVEPSALENIDTLTAKSGPALEREIYAFDDKAGRRIALRFDLTVGMARMVAGSAMPKPVRLACIAGVWRYDEPQYGRYRNFWQWDAEIYGSAGAAADAEIIALTADILASLGLDAVIKINNRKLVEGFLLGIDVKKDELMSVLRFIDKKSKMSESEFRRGLAPYNADAILEFVSLSELSEIERILPDNPLAKEGIAELKELCALLDTLEISYVLDTSIVRGIDYYTGVVYEAWIRGEESIGAVAGGGRYDDLLGLYGQAMPATGIAGGIERLLLSLEKKQLLPPAAAGAQAIVVYASEELFAEALKLCRTLRSIGISAVVDTNVRDLSKQLEYAAKLRIPYAVILGRQERAVQQVRVRNMETGVERAVYLNDDDLRAAFR